MSMSIVPMPDIPKGCAKHRDRKAIALIVVDTPNGPTRRYACQICVTAAQNNPQAHVTRATPRRLSKRAQRHEQRGQQS